MTLLEDIWARVGGRYYIQKYTGFELVYRIVDFFVYERNSEEGKDPGLRFKVSTHDGETGSHIDKPVLHPMGHIDSFSEVPFDDYLPWMVDQVHEEAVNEERQKTLKTSRT
ncbi:hypothetical protein HOA55_04945 [archaeon]|jgi:hypothetical protein|nr:hypothetical protein [archaeon]MBT3578127.1 hypothetical protein [archaeon]MBT6820675.1 hypothetical protein [archaeon]MBT7024915.1 hypothetical protein [archaeon]MBT7238534.1 hypothetical protein [archaeon]